MTGQGSETKVLSEADVSQIIADATKSMKAKGKKVICLIPDCTRTCPTPLVYRLLNETLGKDASRLDFLIALGTHQPMSDPQIDKMLGMSKSEREKRFPKSAVYNHRWDEPSTFKKIGVIPAAEIKTMTGGLFEMEVPISVNKLIFDYDILMIFGPVFPHEVVGMSGGNKYIFPGVSGAEFLNFFHWFSAVITNPKVIGNKNTKVRALIDRAVKFLKMPRFALKAVVHGQELKGLYFGTPEEAWSAAADLSMKLDIIYVDKPYKLVLSQVPEMYDDIWTAGKGMYKLEPVVADGGELIIYAPHITEVSYTHGKILDQIGYHTRDYFLKQWDKFKQFPWGVVAHSTHVRGIGTYENGVEKPRVSVTLATKIPPERCKKLNLDYKDPKTINPKDYAGREKEGVLYVPRAGEQLYRLKNPPEWQKP
jgi:nickel-dependent lactate racemase